MKQVISTSASTKTKDIQGTKTEPISMDEKEQFMLLYDALKEIMKMYIENVVMTLGLLVIIIGWVTTANEARAYLQDDERIRLLALAVVVVIGVLHILTCIVFFIRSAKVQQNLNAMTFDENSKINHLHETYCITLPVLLITLVTDLLMFAILFAVILYAKPTS